MNQLDGQNIAAGVVVLAAVVYLLLRIIALFARRKVAGCAAGCSSCPSSKQSTTFPTDAIVSIEQLSASAEQVRSNGHANNK